MPTIVETNPANFRTSSFSSAHPQSESPTCCVAVKRTGTSVHLRESESRGGPIFIFSNEEWKAFLRGVRNSEFDV